MKRYKFKTRFKHKAHIDITALIDLVFLLVAFFMVTSRLGEISSINVNLPGVKQAAREIYGNTIISVTAKNEIYVNDVKFQRENLLSEFKKNIKKYNNGIVIIRGDKKSQYETIVKIMDILNRAGISKFTLSTVKSQ